MDAFKLGGYFNMCINNVFHQTAFGKPFHFTMATKLIVISILISETDQYTIDPNLLLKRAI